MFAAFTQNLFKSIYLTQNIDFISQIRYACVQIKT